METNENPWPDQSGGDRPFSFDGLRETLLEMAQERSVETLLQLVVSRLSDQPSVALARIWLKLPGDICVSCPLRTECEDQSACLHLAASKGNPLDVSLDWNRTHGSFRRIPIGARKVGHIASTKLAVDIRDISDGSAWIADPDWATRECIRGFVGQPLLHRSDVVGVLGVFLRVPVEDDALLSLRIVADHAAYAIANARAFEQIDDLRSRLSRENEYLKQELDEIRPTSGILGDSPAIRSVLQKIDLVAPTDTSVLILGESGTGKELVARAIHEQSAVRDGPLVRVNCASIARELFESEFFGHVRGSFTGAVQDRVGRFEAAEGGTLFLDEIGEVPMDMQSKLLRVLQERTYERVGDTSTRTTRVRIIAATNQNLKQEVSAGRFREDLYYRLNVLPIETPALRERPADIPLLVRHFLRHHCQRFGVRLPELRKRDLELLKSYSWPGNVRELQNIVEQAALRLRVGPLEFHLPVESGELNSPNLPTTPPAGRMFTYDELKTLERSNLLLVLEHTNWKIYGPRGAAEILGIHPATLSSRMKAMKIARPA